MFNWLFVVETFASMKLIRNTIASSRHWRLSDESANGIVPSTSIVVWFTPITNSASDKTNGTNRKFGTPRATTILGRNWVSNYTTNRSQLSAVEPQHTMDEKCGEREGEGEWDDEWRR